MRVDHWSIAEVGTVLPAQQTEGTFALPHHWCTHISAAGGLERSASSSVSTTVVHRGDAGSHGRGLQAPAIRGTQSHAAARAQLQTGWALAAVVKIRLLDETGTVTSLQHTPCRAGMGSTRTYVGRPRPSQNAEVVAVRAAAAVLGGQGWHAGPVAAATCAPMVIPRFVTESPMRLREKMWSTA